MIDWLHENRFWGIQMYKTIYLWLFLIVFINQPHSESLFIDAQNNSWKAQKAFQHCYLYLNGWLGHRDPASGLIPRNLTSSHYWNAQDSAADNYPFMVLTASMLDHDRFHGVLLDMLHTEILLTNRLDHLPDDFDFSTQTFRKSAPDLRGLIFGGSEYVKDGLIPLTEWLGPSEWADRMIGIQESIWKHAPIETKYGRIPSNDFEINGEQLQVLCRLYWMTADQRYQEWAFRIADYYLLGKSPIESERLSLDDHGCEIISGLAGAYYLAAKTDTKRREAYRPAMTQLIDRILNIATNDDGLFYMTVNPISGKVLNDELTDNWGYDYNAVLNVGTLDNNAEYIDAVKHVLDRIEGYVYYPWEKGGADGYADSIEGGLNLLNRLPNETGFQWVDDSMEILMAKQRPDGVIEGWHGDGNFTRTTLMYALWKTQGVRLEPWRADLAFGAVEKNGTLYLSIQSDWPWRGKVRFDRPRHRDYFNLPSDYPRINQFPEWFTIDAKSEYFININNQSMTNQTGEILLRGTPVEVDGKTPVFIKVGGIR